MKKSGTLLLLLIIILTELPAQPALRLIDHFPEIDTAGQEAPIPLFSVVVNGLTVSSSEFLRDPAGTFFHPQLLIRADVLEIPTDQEFQCRIIRIRNKSGDTLEIENLLPLGASQNRPYITGYGPPGLTRATLFRPDKGPVGLIVPDNARELGFTALDISPDRSSMDTERLPGGTAICLGPGFLFHG